MATRIQFFSEDSDFLLRNKVRIRKWLTGVIRKEGKKPWYVNFIFCSDRYLLELNRQYLNRETLTDVISFNYEEDPGTVSGDVFISVERVRENSVKYLQTFENELNRVLVHGLLHLAGYSDGTKKEKERMTELENKYLDLNKELND